MATTAQRLGSKQMAKAGTLMAALDIGCSKIACLIGRIDPGSEAGFEFAGGGHQQSRGFNAGKITDIEALERSIRLAVEDAERQAGERIEKVVLGVTGPSVYAQLAEAQIDIGQREILARDVRKVWSDALSDGLPKDRTILAAYPVTYGVDDQDGIRDPAGMIGERLRVLLNVVTAPKSLVRNLSECIARAHLGIERIVPSAIAGGVGSLIEDELENGAICIDCGGGVTSVSVFMNNVPAWLGMLPVGGATVTRDIAQGIGTTFAAAERMKTMFGTADLEGPGLAERIEAPRLGDDGRLKSGKMSRGELTAMIYPRIDELFDLVKTQLANSPIHPILPGRIVLTGGTSQLPGVREVAAKVFPHPVRLGRPVNAEILGEIYGQPAFSTAAGLISYSVRGITEATRAGGAFGNTGEKPGRRVVQGILSWIRDNF